jgi:hypothetical protein
MNCPTDSALINGCGPPVGACRSNALYHPEWISPPCIASGPCLGCVCRPREAYGDGISRGAACSGCSDVDRLSA